MRIEVQHIVMGSLVNEQGDGVLSFTNGISDNANMLCSALAADACRSHASVCVLNLPTEETSILIHVQGDHVVFGGGTRTYTTRVVYECRHDVLSQCGGWFPLLPVLDKMRYYDHREFGTSADCWIEEDEMMPLTEHERHLLTLVEQGRGERKVMVKLTDADQLYAEKVLLSPHLASLLRVTAHLMAERNEYLSFAFSVDADSGIANLLTPYLHVIAHNDPVERWVAKEGDDITVDWITL